MANSYNNRTFKIKTSSNPKLIFAIIALILGLASLFFLLAPGINFTYAGSSKLHTISLGGLVWGSTYTNLSAGLVVAFFLGIVASLLADRCQVQLSYAIGVSKPISISVETFNTEHVDKKLILSVIEDLFDFSPAGIIKRFNLTNPSFKYAELSNYGHFGRPDLDLPFEKLDYVDKIKQYIEENK